MIRIDSFRYLAAGKPPRQVAQYLRKLIFANKTLELLVAEPWTADEARAAVGALGAGWRGAVRLVDASGDRI